MPPNLSSSTDVPRSTIDGTVAEEAVSHRANTLVSYLSASFESKLPVFELGIACIISPQLQSIKKETSQIDGATFQQLVGVYAELKSRAETMQKFQSEVGNNEHIPFGILLMESDSLKNVGNTIINEHHGVISNQHRLVDKLCDDMQLEIREVFRAAENIQHRRGQVNAVQGNVVPSVSAFNPMLAPLESTGKVAVGLAAHRVSCKLDEKLKALELLERTLRENAQVAIETRTKLEDYRSADESAIVLWGQVCKTIYDAEGAGECFASGTALTSEQIKLVMIHLSEYLLPIQEYLVKKHPYYGPGITVVREAASFCDVVPKFLPEINAIGSAEKIIESKRQFKFKKIYNELGLAVYEYLESMRVTFTESPVDTTKLQQFLEDESNEFGDRAKVSIYRLDKIVGKHTSRRQSEKAEKERMIDDRCWNNMDRPNRPLVKPEEVQEALKRVSKTIHVIRNLPMASVVGKFLTSIDGEIERTHMALDVCDPTWGQILRTLNEHVQDGLIQFRAHQMGEEPKPFWRRVLERAQFSPKGR